MAAPLHVNVRKQAGDRAAQPGSARPAPNPAVALPASQRKPAYPQIDQSLLPACGEPDDGVITDAAWAALGIGEQIHARAVRAYDQMIGLELRDMAMAGCIPRRPAAGRAPGRPRQVGAKAA